MAEQQCIFDSNVKMGLMDRLAIIIWTRQKSVRQDGLERAVKHVSEHKFIIVFLWYNNKFVFPKTVNHNTVKWGDFVLCLNILFHISKKMQCLLQTLAVI